MMIYFLGLVPAMNELDTSGLDIDDDTLKNLSEVDCNEWITECKMVWYSLNNLFIY